MVGYPLATLLRDGLLDVGEWVDFDLIIGEFLWQMRGYGISDKWVLISMKSALKDNSPWLRNMGIEIKKGLGTGKYFVRVTEVFRDRWAIRFVRELSPDIINDLIDKKSKSKRRYDPNFRLTQKFVSLRHVHLVEGGGTR